MHSFYNLVVPFFQNAIKLTVDKFGCFFRINHHCSKAFLSGWNQGVRFLLVITARNQGLRQKILQRILSKEGMISMTSMIMARLASPLDVQLHALLTYQAQKQWKLFILSDAKGCWISWSHCRRQDKSGSTLSLYRMPSCLCVASCMFICRFISDSSMITNTVTNILFLITVFRGSSEGTGCCREG